MTDTVLPIEVWSKIISCASPANGRAIKQTCKPFKEFGQQLLNQSNDTMKAVVPYVFMCLLLSYNFLNKITIKLNDFTFEYNSNLPPTEVQLTEIVDNKKQVDSFEKSKYLYVITNYPEKDNEGQYIRSVVKHTNMDITQKNINPSGIITSAFREQYPNAQPLYEDQFPGPNEHMDSLIMHANSLSEIVYQMVKVPQLTIISNVAITEINKVIENGNKYLQDKSFSQITQDKIIQNSLHSAGAHQTYVMYMQRKYKIYGSKDKRYINVSKNKVYLKDIRGKYRFHKQ